MANPHPLPPSQGTPYAHAPRVDDQTSPISQVLNALGLTREDLERRSAQMREFLTAGQFLPESAPSSSRVSSQIPSSSTADSRSLSRASSSTDLFTRHFSPESSVSTRDASPGHLVKPEPEEEALPPPRQFVDTMEMVLERQRLKRKQKRTRKHDDLPTWTPLPQIDSPVPRDASPSTAESSDAHTRRDLHEVRSIAQSSAVQHPPVTPMRSKYYREHTSYPGPELPVVKAESPSPAHQSSGPPASTYPYPYLYYSAYASQQSQFLSLPFRTAQASTSTSLQTPAKPFRTQRSQRHSSNKSPLPLSSPPDASSPASSPATRLVNIVSSPGAMEELPPDEPKVPPYRLPPGPYSDLRPHHSYAALIGQAILSSQDHRLTLQEIYEWIVTVYPHFKRGERTWMNSIRHVLSTTVHFRKISRERSAGRSHWAIFDDDLHCFLDGGYRKPGTGTKRGIPGAPRPKAKKRSADEVEEDDTSPSSLAKKSTKRPKKNAPPTGPILPPISVEQPPGLLPALVHPQGKPKLTQPATHHQTYYESCVSAPPPGFAPSEVIFPPLPNPSYRLIASDVSSATIEPSVDEDNNGGVESEDEPDVPPTSPMPPSSPMAPSSPVAPPISTPERDSELHHPSSASSASVPALTPNCSSSSPIPSSDMDADQEEQQMQVSEQQTSEVPLSGISVIIADLDDTAVVAVQNEEGTLVQDAEDKDFAGSLRPVQFWNDSSPSAVDSEGLQPGIELQGSGNHEDFDDDSDDDEEDVPLMLIAQANRMERQKAATVKIKIRALARVPTSPTLHRRKTATVARNGNKNGKRKKSKASRALLGPPATPPRNNSRRKSLLSPVHTPLSHRGLHMSPAASLAHYKSNLDPPPTLLYGESSSRLPTLSRDDDYDDEGPSDLLRTPSRKRNAASSSAHPITPRRLLFPIDSTSPYRTPGGGMLSASPFRTPGGSRGGIFDPHDPSTLLDEELSSLGAAGRDSPAGLFGKTSLYESPNPLDGSPGKWARWW